MVAERSFPRHSARTQGFTLGAPRNVTVTADGDHVLFLRSFDGTDRRNRLWTLDLNTGEETLLADPGTVVDDSALSPEERARRERSRERAAGIVGYATDKAGEIVTFALSGLLFACEVTSRTVTELPVQAAVIDPRPNPEGTHVAYLSRGELRVVATNGTGDRALARPDSDDVTWGAAEFIAAEEMRRSRGYWWSPDGTRLLAARVDEADVPRWYLGDPAEPDRAPASIAYPAAGTVNADVRLAVLGLDGTRVDVDWDRANYPYLVAASWNEHGSPLLTVQTRDQRTQLVLALDPATGTTTEIHRDSSAHWIEIKPGWPTWTPDGRLVRIEADDDAYRLVVGDEYWTTAPLQLRSIVDVADEDILVSASAEDPTQVHLYRVTPQGAERVTPARGVHTGHRKGEITVVQSEDLDSPSPRVRVLRRGEPVAEIANNADTPELALNVELLRVGDRDLCTALLLPHGHRPEHGPLPVLLDPYGGPQAQRVLARQRGFFTSQWFADQGFAVVVIDGRGMTGRDPAWDHAIAGDLAGPTLQDQVDGLHALAAQRPEIDLDRVAIRGWSFGGFLAGLAVLRRPDVFHAAVAGAPVTDQRLYDTHYTERYLGDPTSAPEVYEASSLIADAPHLRRPLLLVHGTIDDNVVPAHSLRLSAALTAAGRPHSLLPLPGVTHMPSDENTAENLLVLQVDFLRRALAET